MSIRSREATRLVFWPSSRGDSGRQGRYCPSQSAPTPCGVSAGKIGKCVTALHRHFRSALSFSSLLTCTRDANAHGSAVVRRHLTPGAIGWWNSVADCANALVASGEFRCPLASMPRLEVAQKKSRLPVAETKENGFEMPCGKCSVLNGLSGNHHSTSVQCESNHHRAPSMTRLEWIAKFIKVWGRHPSPKELKHEAPKPQSATQEKP